MKLENEADVIRIVEEDKWMMAILRHAESLCLPDWWVCAGFVRSKIWDTLHGFATRTPLPDVDVIYFDSLHVDEETEKQLEQRLKVLDPSIPWSVKNEARMHLVNQIPPYDSSVDAISKFPETATALGLSLNGQGEVILAAPCGIEDVLGLYVKPTPYFLEADERAKIYMERIHKKNWVRIWNKVTVYPIDGAPYSSS
ncbi:nucleotidyltransferase family protein [Paenibacillus pinisoli]|uniref:Nucleotidyltransferase family protein n=1 Tax=Paenibacillus pinisoli TaxID=1276110 RepID=A0A3A6PUK4_9BACL|nr:nucleotidyltransferase family protein [Paenibacillus pinisoli]RJX37574.1 nucleotidyltransferase family protein [Paenibacillus pinisoli]